MMRRTVWWAQETWVKLQTFWARNPSKQQVSTSSCKNKDKSSSKIRHSSSAIKLAHTERVMSNTEALLGSRLRPRSPLRMRSLSKRSSQSPPMYNQAVRNSFTKGSKHRINPSRTNRLQKVLEAVSVSWRKSEPILPLEGAVRTKPKTATWLIIKTTT